MLFEEVNQSADLRLAQIRQGVGSRQVFIEACAVNIPLISLLAVTIVIGTFSCRALAAIAVSDVRGWPHRPRRRRFAPVSLGRFLAKRLEGGRPVCIPPEAKPLERERGLPRGSAERDGLPAPATAFSARAPHRSDVPFPRGRMTSEMNASIVFRGTSRACSIVPHEPRSSRDRSQWAIQRQSPFLHGYTLPRASETGASMPKARGPLS